MLEELQLTLYLASAKPAEHLILTLKYLTCWRWPVTYDIRWSAIAGCQKLKKTIIARHSDLTTTSDKTT